MRLNIMTRFLKLESASGIILFVSALAAFILCNSPWGDVYPAIWQTPIAIQVAGFAISHSLLYWINEGLMALFFLLVGLELKREFLEGELASLSQVVLPGAAALGGMIMPALIYCLINYHNPAGLHGWAVPVATDIAFALGVLSLFGRRVPIGLKIFLMALAIFDDVGAIIIIAVFHTASLSYLPLAMALLCVLVLLCLNIWGARHLTAYLLVGVVLWACVLLSGVHATVAGVVLALLIPLAKKDGALLERLEQSLHPWVAYLVMPVFAFANAGVSLHGLSTDILYDSVVLGIVAGLFFGKQIGVFGFAWLVIKLGWAKLPARTGWRELYSVAMLCGIGFTMSLFLGTLAFQKNPIYLTEMRLGVLMGSVLSGVIGAAMLQMALQKRWNV